MFQKTYKFSLMFSTTGLNKGFWIHTGNVVFVIIAFFSCLHLQQHTNLTFPNVKSLASPKWRTTDDLERLPPLTKGPRKNWKPAAWRHEFNPGILFANQPERWLNQRPRPQQSPSKKKSPSFWTPRAPCLGGGGKEAGSIDLNGKSLKKGRSPLSDGFFAVANKAQKTGNEKKPSKGWSGTRCEWCQKDAWCTVNYNFAIYEDQQGNA